MSDNRPPRYEEDGKVIYRASGLGMCDKMFVALAMGYDPKAYPAWFQEILDEGTANEPVIRAMYEEETGRQVMETGHVLEMEILDGVYIRGSIDGLIRPMVETVGMPELFEAKKIRDSGWMRYLNSGVEFQANYPMQTAAYMFMLGDEYGYDWVPMAFTGGRYVQDEKTEEWSITEIHTHSYPDPPVPLLAIKKRIAKLERLCAETDAIGDLPCNISMYPCPVFYLHDDDADEPPVRPSDDIVAPLITEWDSIDAEYSELTKRVRALEADRKRIKEGVQGWLQASGQDSGDVCTSEIGNLTVAMKYLVSPRAGYEVQPTEVTRVTIKVTHKDGEQVANAPKKSRTRKSTAQQGEAPKAAEPASTGEQPAADPKPRKAKLAPRPGTTT